MSIHITTNAKQYAALIKKIKQDISTKVVPHGLDDSLRKSIEELKNKLLYIVNTEIRFIHKVKDSDTLKDDTINIPQADKDWVKELLGVDLSSLNRSIDYTKLFNQNVLVVNNYRLRLHIPESPNGNMEQSYQKALQFFKDAVVISIVNGQVKYYLVNNFNPSNHVKIVCSRDKGITNKSKNRYNNEKESKAERFGKSSIGRYSTWSLKQDGVKELFKDSVDLTPVIENLKKGDFEEARRFLSGYNKNNSSQKMQDLDDKIESSQKKSSTNPSTQSYLEIIKIINSIKLLKKINKLETSYTLVSDKGDDKVLQDSDIFQIIREQTSIWLITHQKEWVQNLVKLIENTITQYIKG